MYLHLANDLGKYMGGYGSGRRGDRVRIESHLRINIRDLNKWGYLKHGCTRSGRLTWTDNHGDESGSVGVRVSDESMRLIYSVTSNDEKVNRDIAVYFDYTQCNFGGSRRWFICPNCHERVGVVVINNAVGCRHCLKLAYSIENESYFDRALRNADKAWQRINGDRTIGAALKPKGMHHKTFERLLSKARRANYMIDSLMFAQLRKLDSSLTDLPHFEY